ncbi:hypothetical protein Egran_00671 [Elaphomyces granulatus]|uniref:Semialdehyde dehydrogenase NAD-binding domain-containing protein n=1 Tax=Elaphomyces granulatus TaxID=519963 RepID=A0A232M556_9EURO|nr:hypothetical protein Egran_00671 [Elaphomyces granulatus]
MSTWGSRGHRFILLLVEHPFLVPQAVGASARSAGKCYKDACSGNLVVRECKAEHFQDCDLVFSGLDSDVAGDAGQMEFLKADIPGFSNAKNYRKHPTVPLVVPTVNLQHLDLIPHQRRTFGLQKGFLVCNSNCAVIGIVIPFAALQARFALVEEVEVVMEQAISGAGYPAIDIMDNIIPFISGRKTKQSGLKVGAICTRVGVTDGHMAFVALRFQNRPPPSAEQVVQAMREYRSEAQHLGCTRAGDRGLRRARPTAARNLSGVVILITQFAALSHNTMYHRSLRILHSEAAVMKGYV